MSTLASDDAGTGAGTLSREAAYAAIAGCCAIIAGAIHALVAPAHFAESWYAGTFFVALAVGQVALAMALRWRLPVFVLVSAVLGHLAVMVLYVVSRTIDLPFVPLHINGQHLSHLPAVRGIGNGVPVYTGSRVEPVGVADMVCLTAELGLVVALLCLLPGRARRGLTTLMLLLGLTGIAARVLGLLQ
jgi:hypothetical protein